MSQARTATAEIEHRLRLINRVFATDELAGRGTDLDDVVRYYRDSSFGYRLVHSKDGAIHMALTPHGDLSERGYYGQADAVEGLLATPTQRALELACGKGFNSNYLAARRPEVQFFGVDLVESHLVAARRRAEGIANAHYLAGDFQRLPFPDAYFDSIFVVEGLCHALDMRRALDEAARTLRPGGRFVVVDAWRLPEFDRLPAVVKHAASLTEHAMAVGHAQRLDEWLSLVAAAGFAVLEDRDLTDSIVPNLRRFERIATGYFRHRRLARLSARILPKRLLQNSIAGYLLPLTIESGAHTYRLIALRRD